MSDTAYAEETGAPSAPSARGRLATVLLMVGFLVLVPILSLMGLLLVMTSDSCGVNTCSTGLIVTGVAVAVGAPVLAFLVTLAWTVVRWRRGRSTWWLPLVGVAVGAALWGVGAALAFSAVG